MSVLVKNGGDLMRVTEHEVRVLLHWCIGRRDDYALQRADGLYTRVRQPLSFHALALHLGGGHTIGTYVIDEQDRCRFAVFDADGEGGLLQLLAVQKDLAAVGIPAYLEGSRRGGHLWVFLARRLAPVHLRAWLLPFCPAGVEFYPKQDALTPERPYGSLVRVPFGVHRRAGRRYPFVSLHDGRLKATGGTIHEALTWLDGVERASVPGDVPFLSPPPARVPTQKKMLIKKVSGPLPSLPVATIEDWCQKQNPVQVIGRYVELDHQGMGCCPFGEHHDDGKDSRPSFRVRAPRPGSLNCWYCYVWQRGGSLFDFLRLWYGFSPRELWRRVLAGESF